MSAHPADARVLRCARDIIPILRTRTDSAFAEVDQDRFGTLYRVGRRGVHTRPIYFVHVICPSTGRDYALRVPMTTNTAQEAVAWTFGLTSEQYAPLIET